MPGSTKSQILPDMGNIRQQPSSYREIYNRKIASLSLMRVPDVATGHAGRAVYDGEWFG
jgi:hypothetical protein